MFKTALDEFDSNGKRKSNVIASDGPSGVVIIGKRYKKKIYRSSEYPGLTSVDGSSALVPADMPMIDDDELPFPEGN